MSRFALLVALLGTVACQHEATDVAVDDAPKHDGIDRLGLADANVLLNRAGSHEKKCPKRRGKAKSACVEQHYYVFAVVAEDAKKVTTVSAWVTCADETKSLAECRKAVKAHEDDVTGTVVVRVGDEKKTMRTKSGWEKAIEDAEKKHNLKARPRSPVIRLGG